MRWLPVLLASVLVLLALPATSANAALPPIHHVYVMVLENESASTTFGSSSPAPYLSQTLRAQGAYLPNYYGIGHLSNDNYIAMISGQAPNMETQADCPLFADFLGGSIGAYGQVQGEGCVYPAGVPTIATQLQAAGLTWRDYNESMGSDPTREAPVCGHPAVGSIDKTQSATATDQYATRHNPFVYFHSIIDNASLCDTHVVNLNALPQDLAQLGTPNYVFITPNLCDDGHDATCAGGGQGGLARADSFLRQWVPQITGSPAFTRDGGLLIITFDEAASSDTIACCGEIPGPGSPQPGINGPGGGVTGAVLLSPYIEAGTVSSQAYNHDSMLRSVEDLFGLGHLGYAQLPGETSFGSDVFACAPAAAPVPVNGHLPAGSELTGVRIVRGRKHSARLTLNSVGASSLTVAIRAKHKRKVTRRLTLAPCRAYTVSLPRGRGRHNVTVSATALAGAETHTLRY